MLLPFIGWQSSIKLITLLYHYLHTIKACFIERFENIQRRKKERARTTGGVKHSDRFNAIVESTQQICPFAIGNSVLGKLAHIQVVGDEIIDRSNFAIS